MITYIKKNPPAAVYAYDAENRLLSAGDSTYAYDLGGNLAGKVEGANTTVYTWNVAGMLNGVSSGTDTYEYAYDGLGNRIKKTVNGTEKRYVVGPESTTLAETDDLGNITAYYVYGLGLISKITPANDDYYYHYDAIGSTVAMTDSTGGIVNKYAYGVFGQGIDENEQIENPFKFVGAFGVMDEGNGTYYMRARYYDPEIGRFISKDPIGLAGGMNMYAYAGGNPLKWIDPEGEKLISIGICALLAIGDAAYTGYQLNRLEDEMITFQRKRRDIENSCSTNEEYLQRYDEIQEIREMELKLIDEQVRARGKGYAFVIPIAVFCAASPFLPF